MGSPEPARGHPGFRPAWPPCIRNGPLERPVIPAWKRQRNTADLRRNAAVWREMPRLSDTATSCRRWRGPGTSSPRRPMKKPLTPRRDRLFPRRCAASAGLPGGATPAPSAARRRELSAHGRRSPSPRTRQRSVDTRLNAPLGPLRLIYRNAGGHRGVPIAREDSLRDLRALSRPASRRTGF